MKPQAAIVKMDVRAALAHGVARLEAAKVPSAALGAELLLLHLLARDRTWLYAHSEETLSAETLARYEDLLSRRAEGVPTQYLIGKQEFWGLEFEVSPSVLIPRPETEHLIEVVLARLGAKRSEALQIADVGTGSGCIAVALANELPQARIIATDISATALDVARRNAQRHGVSGRLEFRQMNLLSDLVNGSVQAEFDVIVSNPPYVGRNGSDELQREVIEHEPHEALFAGEDGLEIYPQLIQQVSKLLKPGGLLVVELGYSLANHVRALLPSAEWTDSAITNDLAGIPRVLAAKRS